MKETVNEPVAVLASFRQHANGRTTRVTPHALEWSGRRYTLEAMGLHHPERRGIKRFHIFSFSSGNIAFRVELDPETLTWTLTEVFYGD